MGRWGDGAMGGREGTVAQRSGPTESTGTAAGLPDARADVGEQGLLFVDGLLSPPADDIGYRGPTACAAAGITYRSWTTGRERPWSSPPFGAPGGPGRSGSTPSATSWSSRSSSGCSTPGSSCTTFAPPWSTCAGVESMTLPGSP